MYNILRSPVKELMDPTGQSLVHGKYYVGPLLRGQSITLACALRRTLLAEIEGFAIIGIHVPNVKHEYEHIPGLKEDMLELSLNLKQIKITSESNTNTTLAKLKVSGSNKKSGFLCAQDLILPEGYTVSNPRAYIASLTSTDVPDFTMELLIARGKGFVLAQDIRARLPTRFIPLDATFTPIPRVSFSFEVSRDNKYETLIFEVWTFVGFDPEILIAEASFILERTFRRFRLVPFQSTIKRPVSLPTATKLESAPTELDQTSLRELKLTVRARNCLIRAGVKTVGDVTRFSHKSLLQLQGCGVHSVKEIEAKMLEYFNWKIS
uniref:DNA-directed RNA polymerase n=1 Tax=Karenia brevis TaxID=156230 RepID=A0A0S2QDG7_KARBR|nr:RNA polymerase subunit alpha [Karenia brevis]